MKKFAMVAFGVAALFMIFSADIAQADVIIQFSVSVPVPEVKDGDDIDVAITAVVNTLLEKALKDMKNLGFIPATLAVTGIKVAGDRLIINFMLADVEGIDRMISPSEPKSKPDDKPEPEKIKI